MCHIYMKPIHVILFRVKWKVLWIVKRIFIATHIFSSGYIKCWVHTVDEADRKLGTVHLYVACCTTAANSWLQHKRAILH